MESCGRELKQLQIALELLRKRVGEDVVHQALLDSARSLNLNKSNTRTDSTSTDECEASSGGGQRNSSSSSNNNNKHNHSNNNINDDNNNHDDNSNDDNNDSGDDNTLSRHGDVGVVIKESNVQCRSGESKEKTGKSSVHDIESHMHHADRAIGVVDERLLPENVDERGNEEKHTQSNRNKFESTDINSVKDHSSMYSDTVCRNGSSGTTDSSNSDTNSSTNSNSSSISIGSKRKQLPGPILPSSLQEPNGKTLQELKKERKEKKRQNKQQREMDFSRYESRYIALRLFYVGEKYSGLASQETKQAQVSKSPKSSGKPSETGASGADVVQGCKSEISEERESIETIEKHLFNALLQTRLIQSRKSCFYSRCGRTDKGVSAAGQIISLQVRSAIPAGAVLPEGTSVDDIMPGESVQVSIEETAKATEGHSQTKSPSSASPSSKKRKRVLKVTELNYESMLNRVLPTDIQVTAFAPAPPHFIARFSAISRTYRYFFIQKRRDIARMRRAAAFLVGLHDFRNFCKMDVAAVSHFFRRIFSVSIDKVNERSGKVSGNIEGQYRFACAGRNYDEQNTDCRQPGSGRERASNIAEKMTGRMEKTRERALMAAEDEYFQLFRIEITGQAFLWHQVRCMVAVLFLVGEGKEQPEIVKDLLNVEKNPAKPEYTMASELPLVLHDSNIEEFVFRFDPANLNDVTEKLEAKYEELRISLAQIQNLLVNLYASPVKREDLERYLRALRSAGLTKKQKKKLKSIENDAEAYKVRDVSSLELAPGLDRLPAIVTWESARPFVLTAKSHTKTHIPLMQRKKAPTYEAKLEALQGRRKEEMDRRADFAEETRKARGLY